MYKIVSLLLLYSIAIQTSQPPLYITDCMHAGFVGAISSALSSFAYSPFHYIQNRRAQGLPVHLKNIHHCLRGYPLLVSGSIPVTMAQMVAYKAIQNHTQCSSNNNDHNEKTTCAAALAAVASAPFANALQLMTLHKQNTGLPMLTILNTFPHSYRSLGRGFIPTTLQGIFFVTTYTNGLPLLKDEIHRHCNNNIIACISSAFLSALLLTITTQPLRVMAIKLHADIHKEAYKGIYDVALKTIQSDGFNGIYKAWEWRTIGNSIAIPVLTTVQHTLNNLK